MSGFISESAYIGVTVSVLSFMFGNYLKKRFRLAIINPIIIASAVTIAFLLVTGTDYSEYKTKASVLSWLLTPATVSLAIPLYEQIEPIKKNLKAILAGIVTGVAVSVVCVILLCLIFNLSHAEYVTLLPKGVTSAIGLSLSEKLGGYGAVTVIVIILTGVTGNLICPYVFKWFHISDPVAKGIAIGTSSHAIGTVRAFEIGEIEGAFSSISIVAAGIMTVVFSVLLQNII